MLPRRLLRTRFVPACVAGPSSLAIARPLGAYSLTTSSSRGKPAAAQLAEEDDDYRSNYYPSSSSSSSSSRPDRPQPISTSGLQPLRRTEPLFIPPPLPSDIVPTKGEVQLSLYPTTGVIDSLSMISICLRRPETVARGFAIFLQLVEDAQTGVKTMPDADVWSRVIEAVAQAEGTGAKLASPKGRASAETLVRTWEALNMSSDMDKVAGRRNQGIKLYRGWFAGIITSKAFGAGGAQSLGPLEPYILRDPRIVRDLLEGVKESDLPRAVEAITKLAEKENVPEIMHKVDEFQQILETRKARVLNDVVPDVQPVTESYGQRVYATDALGRERKKAKPATPELMQVSGDGAAGDDVRFAVSNLRSTLRQMDKQELPISRQYDVEHASYEAARLEMMHNAEKLQSQKLSAVSEAQTLQREQLQAWMHEWSGKLKDKITSELEAMQERVDAENEKSSAKQQAASVTSPKYSTTSQMSDSTILLYLSLLPPDRLALITILETMRMIGTGGIVDGMKALRGMNSVGRAVETEYRADMIRNVSGAESPQWLKTIDPATQKPSSKRVGAVWRGIGERLKGDEEEMYPDEPEASSSTDSLVKEEWKDIWTPAWSQLIQVNVGAWLVRHLVEVATVTRTGRDRATGDELTEEQPAFSHANEYVKGKKLGIIKVNPVVASRLSKDTVMSIIHPKHLPMLVEPRPWTSHESGAYMIHKVPVMRYKDSVEQQTFIKQACDAGHLEPVFHGLDVLSATPWQINRQVFDVVLKAWNIGDAIADIPASEEKLAKEPMKRLPEDADPQQRAAYIERMKVILAAQRKDHSERCKFNYNLEIARAYLHETFYLPHNMDFRGRAYPIPPHLSPVGDDLCRGLLKFGVKKPLGKNGMKWMQIHLANVYGFDKASFEERAQFAVDHEADILDSADNPLDGKKWWLKAEDPWQCLATCFELSAAIRSGNPETYESAMPVHQDGTCNGMQHYAALGGDVRGAKAVNLENGDRPADIYTGVAEVVNRVIKDDQAQGHEVALMITEPLGRKVVKQTVMTTVYGVTFIGARDQVAKQLIARGDIPPEKIFIVSSYIAKTVLSCIGDLFTGAKAIMEWLTTAARLISRSIPPNRVEAAAQALEPLRSRGRMSKAKTSKETSRLVKELMTSVIWTTPLGLPVVQPYRKQAKKQVMTALQTVFISDPNAPAEVSPTKQATAFPPNFVHSLDATHMLLTALKCRQAGITFSAVHDSYWTHASTVEPMSDLIRDTFVHLHKQDLIEELRAEFLERYGENRIPVRNASSISASAAARTAKAKLSAKRFEELLKKQSTSAVADLGLDFDGELGTGTNSDADAVTNMDVDAAMDAAADPLESAADDPEDPDSEFMAPVPGSGVRASTGLSATTTAAAAAAASERMDASSISLSAEDLAHLGEARGEGGAGGPIEEEVIEGQRFIRFRDALPPAPKRGDFRVENVRKSAYFFS